jgi:hypothetical protein
MGSDLVWSKPWFIVRKVLAGSLLIWFLSDTTAKSLGWAVFQLPLLVLAIVGISRRPQWSLVTQFLLTFAVVFLLAYVMVSPLARYSSPVMPVLMLFGSGGLVVALAWVGWPIRTQAFRPQKNTM